MTTTTWTLNDATGLGGHVTLNLRDHLPAGDLTITSIQLNVTCLADGATDPVAFVGVASDGAFDDNFFEVGTWSFSDVGYGYPGSYGYMGVVSLGPLDVPGFRVADGAQTATWSYSLDVPESLDGPWVGIYAFDSGEAGDSNYELNSVTITYTTEGEGGGGGDTVTFCDEEALVGDLVIDEFALNTVAWRVENLYEWWLPATQRGNDKIRPGVDGVFAVRRRKTATRRTLQMFISGEVDAFGVPYDNPFNGLSTNLFAFEVNLVDPVTTGNGTRTALLTLPNGNQRGGPVTVLGMEISDIKPTSRFCYATIDISIPGGSLPGVP